MTHPPNWPRIGLCILIWSIFAAKSLWQLDPDLGQHLKTGELITKSGLPVTDPFSYTMPSWKYINHAWLSDVLVYLGHNLGGIFPLATIYATLATTSLFLLATPGRWSLLTILLGAATFVGRVGVREQVIDWFLLALILRITLHPKLWQKFKWFLPPITLFWANLHGGVFAGLAIIGISLLGGALEKRLKSVDFVVFVASLLATLVNPYGAGIWKQILLEIFDMGLRSTVSEWQPWYAEADFGFWFSATMLAVFGYHYRKTLSPTEKLITFALFLSGVSSLRNMTLFSLAAIHSLGQLLQHFDLQIRNVPHTVTRSAIFYRILIVLSITIFLTHSTVELHRARLLSEYNYYPSLATRWLTDHPPSGNLFTDYNWGSYLIWKLPQYKTFVDGRMPSWRWNAPQGESDSAFAEFIDIAYRGIDFAPSFSNYRIAAVLWPKHFPQSPLVARNPTTHKLEIYHPDPLPLRLTRAGWKIVYEDNVSIILTTNHNL